MTDCHHCDNPAEVCRGCYERLRQEANDRPTRGSTSMTTEHTDDSEAITAEWLSSIRVYPGDNDGSLRSQEHEIRIDAGNAVGRSVIYGDEPGESVYLGISLLDGLCYVEACDEQNNTVSLVELGIRRTRGEFRQLLRALRAWDAETFREHRAV